MAPTGEAGDGGDRPRVLIAGGGPGGLLAAILLDGLGVQSTVLEGAKEPDDWSAKSYTIVLSDRGLAALDRGGCLGHARESTHSIERGFVYFFDGKTGELKATPRKTPALGFTRPGLVRCLEGVAGGRNNVTLRRGAGVARASAADDGGVVAHLDDGTVVAGTHIVGADGKWSRVRKSFPRLNDRAEVVSAPSFGVHMDCPTAPKGFRTDGTYVVSPPKGCMFYIIASPRPAGAGFSISLVCYDETLERYPWLAPAAGARDLSELDWEDEHLPGPQDAGAGGESLSERLEAMFQTEVPAFHEALERETFASARVNRRITWLKTSPRECGDGDGGVAYSTADGRVALVGDAAHAMTPSMGEGCNMALESGVRLADAVSSAMERRGEEVCSAEALSEGFSQYGKDRPGECIPIQEASAARSVLPK